MGPVELISKFTRGSVSQDVNVRESNRSICKVNSIPRGVTVGDLVDHRDPVYVS